METQAPAYRIQAGGTKSELNLDHKLKGGGGTYIPQGSRAIIGSDVLYEVYFLTGIT